MMTVTVVSTSSSLVPVPLLVDSGSRRALEVSGQIVLRANPKPKHVTIKMMTVMVVSMKTGPTKETVARQVLVAANVLVNTSVTSPEQGHNALSAQPNRPLKNVTDLITTVTVVSTNPSSATVAPPVVQVPKSVRMVDGLGALLLSHKPKNVTVKTMIVTAESMKTGRKRTALVRQVSASVSEADLTVVKLMAQVWNVQHSQAHHPPKFAMEKTTTVTVKQMKTSPKKAKPAGLA